MNKPRLLNVQQVAEFLGVPKSWVYVHIKDIPHFKLGKYLRFREDEISAWLARCTDAAA